MALLALLLAVGPVPTPSLLSLREAAALAQATPPAQGGAAQQQPASKPETQPSQAKPSDDDFNLLAPEKKPDAAALAAQARIQSETRRRRTMLQLHQIGGFATPPPMTAKGGVGELNYMDKYGGGGGFGAHKTGPSISADTPPGGLPPQGPPPL